MYFEVALFQNQWKRNFHKLKRWYSEHDIPALKKMLQCILRNCKLIKAYIYKMKTLIYNIVRTAHMQ